MYHCFINNEPLGGTMFLFQKKSLSIAYFCGVLMLGACGSGINGGPTVNVNFVASSSSASFAPDDSESFMQKHAWAKQLTSLAMGETSFPIFHDPSEHNLTVNIDSGSANPDELQYAIYEVKICESLSVSGTAFNDPTNCSILYKSDNFNQSDYDSNNVTAPYLDMMQMSATRTALNKGITVSPGTYNYGVISWFKPIKVKGSVTLSGSSGTVFTKSSMTQSSYVAVMPGMQTGPAQEATVTLQNGGAWFKFQSPWTYDGSSQVQLDLVFNPDGILKGSASTSNYAMQTSASGGFGINIPLLAMTPVVHTASDITQKEVYTVAGQNGDVIIELYYNKSDSSKTIYGVLTRSIYNASTTTDNLMDPPQTFSVSTSGSNVTLLNYQGSTIATLARLTTAGSSGTLTWNCDSSVNQGSSACSSAHTSGNQSLSYTLTRIKDAN